MLTFCFACLWAKTHGTYFQHKFHLNTHDSFIIRSFCKAPRSSLAWKNHIDVGAGVIDSDYRGEVKVVLFNHNNTDFESKISSLSLFCIKSDSVIK